VVVCARREEGHYGEEKRGEERGRTRSEVLERFDGGLRSDLVTDVKIERSHGVLALAIVQGDDSEER
jgi:hypothetical protein